MLDRVGDRRRPMLVDDFITQRLRCVRQRVMRCHRKSEAHTAQRFPVQADRGAGSDHHAKGQIGLA